MCVYFYKLYKNQSKGIQRKIFHCLGLVERVKILLASLNVTAFVKDLLTDHWLQK